MIKQCQSCRKMRDHKARGLCAPCYETHRNRKDFVPARVPTNKYKYTDTLIKRVVRLNKDNSLHEIAVLLGITYHQARECIKKHNQKIIEGMSVG